MAWSQKPARGSVPQLGPERDEPGHEGDAAISLGRLGFEADEVDQRLPWPLTDALDLVAEGDQFRACGHGQVADVRGSQVMEAPTSAVAESTGRAKV